MAAVLTRPTDVPNQPQMNGQFKEQWFDLALDNSYPTGGESVTLAAIGLTRVVAVKSLGGGGLAYQYDNANQKLLAYLGTTGAEVSNAGDLSAVTAQRVAFVGY